MNSKFVVRPDLDSYSAVCDFLQQELGFQVISLNTDEKEKRLRSKKEIIVDFLLNGKNLFKYINQLRNAEVIIQIGELYNILLMCLSKIRIIKCNKIFWWGFFLHNPKNIRKMYLLLKILRLDKTKFIVFSEYEQRLYASKLKLEKEAFIYLPYGNWNSEDDKDGSNEIQGVSNSDYFFSGGYSNRDYVALIEAWRIVKSKLIIIASRNNKDLCNFIEGGVPQNITILLDESSDSFDKYLSGAKACVLPFKYNTGASGQSVALRCMRLNKLMVATETDVITEYIKNGETGFVIKNLYTELPEIVRQINENEEMYKKMLCKSRQLYETKFAYNEITKRLTQIIDEKSE